MPIRNWYFEWFVDLQEAFYNERNVCFITTVMGQLDPILQIMKCLILKVLIIMPPNYSIWINSVSHWC